MNCLLLFQNEFDPASKRALVTGRRRKHADEILKASPGETLRVGLIDGRLGLGKILELDAQMLEMQVEFHEDPPAKLPLTLVLALPRPPVFRRLLSTVASLGVQRLLVVGTARTEKSFWQSHVLEPENISERLVLGLEQARDSVLPAVEIHRYFESLVDEVLPRYLEGRRGLLAHPQSEIACPHSVEQGVLLFVGPEGGFVDYEVDRLRGIGFESVHLGHRILRVEPVIPFLVGRLFP